MPAAGSLLVASEVGPDFTADYTEWHNREHLPDTARCAQGDRLASWVARGGRVLAACRGSAAAWAGPHPAPSIPVADGVSDKTTSGNVPRRSYPPH